MTNQTVDVRTLPLQEIESIVHQVNEEVEIMRTSIQRVHATINSFKSSETSINRVQKSSHGQKSLIPLTESIYVDGYLPNTNVVTLEMGTGYSVTLPAQLAIKYIRKKIEFLEAQQIELTTKHSSREDILKKLVTIFQEKQAMKT